MCCWVYVATTSGGLITEFVGDRFKVPVISVPESLGLGTDIRYQTSIKLQYKGD